MTLKCLLCMRDLEGTKMLMSIQQNAIFKCSDGLTVHLWSTDLTALNIPIDRIKIK